jgi:ribosomal protein L7Ae-like RNA K-turn-binding protein
MAVVVGREDSREAEALLGFAIRSGKAVFGIPAVESLVKTGGIRLLLLAGEASQNTQAKIERLASAHGVRLTRFTGTFALKTIPGKPHCKVVGITDADFARRIDTALDENNLRGVAVGE